MIKITMLDTALVECIISAMGWEDGEDRGPYLRRLECISAEQALRLWAKWELGYADWADAFLARWRQLQAAQQEATG